MRRAGGASPMGRSLNRRRSRGGQTGEDFGRADRGCVLSRWFPPQLPLLREEGNDHSIPPHDGSGDEKDNRSESDKEPKSFDGPSGEAAKVKAGNPSKDFVART